MRIPTTKEHHVPSSSKFKFNRTVDGAFGVEGHPDHPRFTFACVRRVVGNMRKWEVVNVYVKDAEVPTDTFNRREEAAQAALDADLAARQASADRRTCDRNVPLGVINSLIMSNSLAYVLDIDQINDDHFRVVIVRENPRTGGDRQSTIVLNREGDLVEVTS
jgi:hypothetical protein